VKSHYVTFADNSVEIQYEEQAHGELLDYLFGDMASVATDRPLSRIRLSRSAERDATRLEQDGTRLYKGQCSATLARTLVEKTLYALVDNDTSGLAFHAAAVCSGDTGVLIPGHSGAGKSTLAVWLATRGFNYLTDELAHIPLGGSTIEAFTRPINLKTGGGQMLENELDVRGTDEEAILKNTRVSIVPHRLLNPEHCRLTPQLRFIVFPNLIDTGEHRLELVSRAQAGLKLVECLVNGRNLPGHGFDEVSRLVRDAPAYRLDYTGFATLPGLLGGILPRLRT